LEKIWRKPVFSVKFYNEKPLKRAAFLKFIFYPDAKTMLSAGINTISQPNFPYIIGFAEKVNSFIF
jgi:hypothetical protein